ncbi:MAG: hypothetical protein IPO30_06550 [Hyphomonadaceae bacterium]|nr:hypothetical protein [Hyphomonadaceae bacterium]
MSLCWRPLCAVDARVDHLDFKASHEAVARIGAVAVVLLAGMAYWFADNPGAIVTSDARVRARMATISSRTSPCLGNSPPWRSLSPSVAKASPPSGLPRTPA